MQIVLTIDPTSTYTTHASVLVSILAVFTFFRKYNYFKYTIRNFNNTANLRPQKPFGATRILYGIQLDSKIPLSSQSLRGLVHFRRKIKSRLLEKEYYMFKDFFVAHRYFVRSFICCIDFLSVLIA